MKSLIILSIALFSFNAFSAEVGEDKKGECTFSDQSSKREAKVVQAPVSQEASKEAAKSKAK